MFFSNPVKHIFTLSFVSGHIWVKDVPTHYFWISLSNLDANKILMGKWFTCAQHWVAQQSSFIGTSNNCTYAWNILQEHHSKPLWANGHSAQGLYPCTKYFKRETLLRIEWHNSQLNHFHVKWDTESDALHKICCSAKDNPEE